VKMGDFWDQCGVRGVLTESAGSNFEADVERARARLAGEESR